MKAINSISCVLLVSLLAAAMANDSDYCNNRYMNRYHSLGRRVRHAIKTTCVSHENYCQFVPNQKLCGRLLGKSSSHRDLMVTNSGSGKGKSKSKGKGSKSEGKGSKKDKKNDDSDVCVSSTTFTASTSASFDKLVLPAAFGEDGVTWNVALASRITKFEFTLPSADDAQQATQQALVDGISTQIPTSSITTDLVIPDSLASPSCTEGAPTVNVTIPRTVRILCIGDVCRPVLCTLGPEYVDRFRLTDISFAPSNTEFLFGSGLDCRITPPADWSNYVQNVIGADPNNLPPDYWFYQDLDGDGASNIVEYYGIPIASLFADMQIGSSGPFPTDPRDPDGDSDLYLDGFELLYGQDPTVFNPVDGDADQDSVSDFTEFIFRTNPFMADTDGDGVDDATEMSDGTNPFDDTDFSSTSRRRLQDEEDPCEELTVELTLTVGDPSGSNSERWTLNVGNVEHQATTFGVVRSETYTFSPGTYSVSIQHRDSNLDTPDYDYTSSITVADNPNNLDVTIDDPQGLLGSDFSSSTNGALGKFATLTIVQTDGVCDYTTCAECRADDECRWDEGNKACKKDCRLFSFFDDSVADCPCEKCKRWAEEERMEFENEETDWIRNLPRCPCTVTFSGQEDDDYAPSEWSVDSFCSPNADCSVNHPGAEGCIRQYSGGFGNQCCYRANGSIIDSGRGAGTPDKAGASWFPTHYFRDKVTYDDCCVDCEIPSVCNEYIGGGEERGAREDPFGCV